MAEKAQPLIVKQMEQMTQLLHSLFVLQLNLATQASLLAKESCLKDRSKQGTQRYMFTRPYSAEIVCLPYHFQYLGKSW